MVDIIIVNETSPEANWNGHGQAGGQAGEQTDRWTGPRIESG